MYLTLFTIVQNGTSGNMMKSSAKRRRSKAQIFEDKATAMKKEAEIQEKLAAWAQMEKENSDMRESL